MRIGLDCKWYFSGPVSGRVLVRNLADALSARYPEHDFHLLLRTRDRLCGPPLPRPNVHAHYCWGGNNMLSNVAVVPHAARSLDLAACVFQNFAPITSSFRRIAFVLDGIFLTNPEYFTVVERLYFAPMRWLARRAHRVATISDAERNRLAAHGFAPLDRIDTVHLGVDARFRPRATMGEEQLALVRRTYDLPERYLLYLGRLNERKNLHRLLQAFATLEDRSCSLVLGGARDWRMGDIEGTIQQLGISDRVKLTGFVDDAHVPAVYAMARAFCYVSLDEGFGLPPLEAMACGVPVVVSAIGALTEVCGSAGIYVDPHEPSSIARALRKVLESDGLCREHAVLGERQASAFTWSRSAESLMRCICRASGERS